MKKKSLTAWTAEKIHKSFLDVIGQQLCLYCLRNDGACKQEIQRGGRFVQKLQLLRDTSYWRGFSALLLAK